MRKEWLAVTENIRIARDVWRMRLMGNTGELTAPGQFVNVRTGGYYLRRPISVCDWNENEITLIYKVVCGFASAADVFYRDEFAALGCTVKIATIDGTYGVCGTVVGLLDGNYTYSCACGPIPMLRAVYDRLTCPGAYSFEERMGCGFGACMGCTCKTKYGAVRICRDGPVLEREAIVW